MKISNRLRALGAVALALTTLAFGLAVTPAQAAPAAAISQTKLTGTITLTTSTGASCGTTFRSYVTWSSLNGQVKVTETGVYNEVSGHQYFVDGNHLTTGSTVVERYEGGYIIPHSGAQSLDVGSTIYRTPPVWHQLHLYDTGRPACGAWGQVQLSAP